MTQKQLTHLDSHGRARMVDVTQKAATSRHAVAEAYIRLSRQTLALLRRGKLPKGNALETARLAGIQAAKRTPDLIPLCHPLLLTHVDVEAEPRRNGVRFLAIVSCTGSKTLPIIRIQTIFPLQPGMIRLGSQSDKIGT